MTLDVTRAQNYPDWYQEVIAQADLAETSSVRGCMVIKPWGYGIWERIQALLDKRIKDTGHVNAYFPLFIPLRLFEKEAAHIEGFAKEMAMVTHTKLTNENGKLKIDGELEEPLVVRPTSEMIISECFSNWVQSYRDLPLLINQWANVVRWEMRTRLFLRTSEFLWQEGHTAHATEAEAVDETLLMLEQYRSLVEDDMAIPVITGPKPEYDKFPGAVDTYTLEAIMQDGRALQMGTSHYLGQTFAKASDISYQDDKGQKQFVHTTSWGVSTRLIGGLIMTHSDDVGLRLPPKLAPQQIVLVPILRGDGTEDAVMDYARKVEKLLKTQSWSGESVRVLLDKRLRDAPDKKWEWLKKGAPLIVEIGPRDVEARKVAVRSRLNDVKDKTEFVELDAFVSGIATRLDTIQQGLWQQAMETRSKFIRTDITTPDAFAAYFGNKNAYLTDGQDAVGFVRASWCGDIDATEAIMKDMTISIRVVPKDQPSQVGNCVLTGTPGKMEVIYARNY